MICVIKIQDGDVAGWIQGKDCLEVAREAQYAGQQKLHDELTELEQLRPGKHQLKCGYTVLAS